MMQYDSRSIYDWETPTKGRRIIVASILAQPVMPPTHCLTGEAELARSRKQAEQTIVVADADLERSRREAERMNNQAMTSMESTMIKPNSSN
jgi:hypothetical protein